MMNRRMTSTAHVTPSPSACSVTSAERVAGEVGEDLAHQLLAVADPAVERRAPDAEVLGERLHVDTLAPDEHLAGERDGIAALGADEPRGDVGHATNRSGTVKR